METLKTKNSGLKQTNVPRGGRASAEAVAQPQVPPIGKRVVERTTLFLGMKKPPSGGGGSAGLNHESVIQDGDLPDIPTIFEGEVEGAEAVDGGIAHAGFTGAEHNLLQYVIRDVGLEVLKG